MIQNKSLLTKTNQKSFRYLILEKNYLEIPMKAHYVRGHNPAPILGKGGVHQPKKEHIPELEYDLYDFYLEDNAGEVDSPESLFA